MRTIVFSGLVLMFIAGSAVAAPTTSETMAPKGPVGDVYLSKAHERIAKPAKEGNCVHIPCPDGFKNVRCWECR